MKNKILKELYCQFLIAAQGNFTMTAMADLLQTLSDDKINRWTKEVKLTAAILWEYAQYWVERSPGYLIGDDLILEKESGAEIELTSKQYSASDGKFVNGIGLTTLIPLNIYYPKRYPLNPLLSTKKGGGRISRRLGDSEQTIKLSARVRNTASPQALPALAAANHRALADSATFPSAVQPVAMDSARYLKVHRKRAAVAALFPDGNEAAVHPAN